ncbi:hypothetical protein EH220_03860, partial [bacterium]
MCSKDKLYHRTSNFVISVFAVMLTCVCFAQPIDTVWTRHFGEPDRWEFDQSIQPTQDGGYIIAGGFNVGGESWSDSRVYKVDSLGFYEWEWGYTVGEFRDSFDAAWQNDNGEYTVIGDNGWYSNSDIIVARLHENGDTLWTKQIGGPEKE